jgi:hypothetical protein
VSLKKVNCSFRAENTCPFEVREPRGRSLLPGKTVTLYNPNTGELWQRRAVMGIQRSLRVIHALWPVQLEFDIPNRFRFPPSVSALMMHPDDAVTVLYSTLLSMVARERVELWRATVEEGQARRLEYLVVAALNPPPVRGLLEQAIMQALLDWYESAAGDDWPQGAPINLFMQGLQREQARRNRRGGLLQLAEEDALQRAMQPGNDAGLEDDQESLLAIHSQLWEQQRTIARHIKDKIRQGLADS